MVRMVRVESGLLVGCVESNRKAHRTWTDTKGECVTYYLDAVRASFVYWLHLPH